MLWSRIGLKNRLNKRFPTSKGGGRRLWRDERALLDHYFQIELKIKMLAFVEGGKPENTEKNPRSMDEN